MVFKLECCCRILLNNCVEKLQTFPEYTLLDAAGKYSPLVLNQHAKSKEGEAGSVSRTERQKSQRLRTQGAAGFGFVRILSKASNLPVSKVRLFSLSKTSYTKFILARRKFRRLKAFLLGSRMTFGVLILFLLINGKRKYWCKVSTSSQDLFHRTVNAE